MTTIGYVAPISLALTGFVLFYLSFRYKQEEKIGWFEAFFLFGNLFILAALLTVYNNMASRTFSYANVVLPIFQAMLFVYILLNIYILYKLWRWIMKVSFNLAKENIKV